MPHSKYDTSYPRDSPPSEPKPLHNCSHLKSLYALESMDWIPVDSLDASTNESHGQVLALLDAADFRYLQEVAIRSRKVQNESVASDITCTINVGLLTFGMNNLVLKVAFSDNVNWVVRIHYVPLSQSQQHEFATDMLSELATLRIVRSRTTIPVPLVFAFEVSASNDFGFPYVLMEHLEGRVLDSTIASRVPAERLPYVAGQLADVLFQLENLTFDQLGRVWCGEDCNEPPRIIPLERNGEGQPTSLAQTSLEWFYNFRQEQNRSVLEAHPDDAEWKAACWVLKTAISHIVVEDRLHGPFPLCHFDLHHGNLLFNDQYKLTGVIDWSQAATAPLERLAVSPELITFPGLPDLENQVIIDFRSALRHSLQSFEDKADESPLNDGRKTTLSEILGSKQAEITHRCTYSRPNRALYDGRMVAELIYGPSVSWKQLVAAYGEARVY